MYKSQIKNLWTTTYKSTNSEINNQTTTTQNSLAAHMSNKRKISYTDKLEAYFSEPPADFNMDILAFWKVNYK